MNYQKIVDDFITEYPDYKSDVINFTEYLETHWGNSLSGEPLRILLKGIDVEFILQSLIYNVEDIQRYKSKTKAKRYSTVVGLFLTTSERLQMLQTLNYMMQFLLIVCGKTHI